MTNPTMELENRTKIMPMNSSTKELVSATGATIIAPEAEGGMIDKATADSRHYVNVSHSVADKLRELAELPRDLWGTTHGKKLRVEKVITMLDQLCSSILRMLDGRRPTLHTESMTERHGISRGDVLMRLARTRDSVISMQSEITELPIAPRDQLVELARECRLTVALYREFQRRFHKAESRFLSPGNARQELANAMGKGSIRVAQAKIYAIQTSFTKEGNF